MAFVLSPGIGTRQNRGIAGCPELWGNDAGVPVPEIERNSGGSPEDAADGPASQDRIGNRILIKKRLSSAKREIVNKR